MVSKASSEITTPDDQPPSDKQEAIMRSPEDAAPEQRVNTRGERSVTERERTITRSYAKQQGNKKGKGKAKK
jgi:hypothetical protein